jgi:hypothetical protein
MRSAQSPLLGAAGPAPVAVTGVRKSHQAIAASDNQMTALAMISP